MKNFARIIASAVALGGSGGLAAAELEGTRVMLCAVTQTVVCDDIAGCVKGPANAVNLPVFFKIDLDAKTAESARSGGERRVSKIEHMSTDGPSIKLVGIEANAGWSAAIDKTTGGITVAAAEGEIGFIVFGSCLAR